jgi:hypothetical protein
VIALRPAEGHPVLVSTSRHVTQGIVDVTNEQWNPATQELTGTSAVVGNDPYELRIAGMNDGGPWKLVSVTVSSDDAVAGVAIAPREAAGDDWAGWRRVGIDSKQNRSVRWTLKFAGL